MGFSAFVYDGIMRQAMADLKYASAAENADYFADITAKTCGERIKLFNPDVIIPVPIHRSRRAERGYNQAEKIAAALSLAFGGKVCRWLKRKTFVVSQTKLSKEQRERNVAYAFECVLKNVPATGTVVLVDDVFTTGATTSACLAAFGRNFPLPIKVCTLLYDEPASAAADYAADNRVEWEVK